MTFTRSHRLLQAVDAGEDPSEIAAARRARRGGADFGDEESSVGSPAPERRKKKGRPRKEEYEGTPVNGKRKRAGGKSMSVTPFADDDEESRDAVGITLSRTFIDLLNLPQRNAGRLKMM